MITVEDLEFMVVGWRKLLGDAEMYVLVDYARVDRSQLIIPLMIPFVLELKGLAEGFMAKPCLYYYYRGNKANGSYIERNR